jgi:DNA processing protein
VEPHRQTADRPEWVAEQRDRGTIYVLGVRPSRSPVVAIVGARGATRRGCELAREIARDLAGRGALVISGGAVGIDTAAHAGALAAGAPTVAVVTAPEIAGGLPYPDRSHALYRTILSTGGALISPFRPGITLRKGHFVRRNHLMAELADAVIVIEASPSSGSLHTAAAARSLGRPLGAVPGTPGADALIAAGAAPIEDAAGVMAAIAGEPAAPSPAVEASADERRVLAGLPAAPTTIAEARILGRLALRGLAIAMPGGRYVRSRTADAIVTLHTPTSGDR